MEAAPTPGGPPAPGRLAIVAGAALLLAVVVTVAALSASGGAPEGDDPENCLAAWNESQSAIGDGVHAYQGHDYGPVLVTRVDDSGKVLPPGADDGRCAVIFATGQVGLEPDFGVRVHSSGQWTGLYFTDGVAPGEIARMQREAVSTANATLQPDGSLVPGS